MCTLIGGEYIPLLWKAFGNIDRPASNPACGRLRGLSIQKTRSVSRARSWMARQSWRPTTTRSTRSAVVAHSRVSAGPPSLPLRTRARMLATTGARPRARPSRLPPRLPTAPLSSRLISLTTRAAPVSTPSGSNSRSLPHLYPILFALTSPVHPTVPRCLLLCIGRRRRRRRRRALLPCHRDRGQG